MFISQFCVPQCPSSFSHPGYFVCGSLGRPDHIYLYRVRTRFLILFLACINYSDCVPLHLSSMEPGCSVSVELSPSNSSSICLSPAHALCLTTPPPTHPPTIPPFKPSPTHTVDKICLYLISAGPSQPLLGILIMTVLHGKPSLRLQHTANRAGVLLGWLVRDFCCTLCSR